MITRSRLLLAFLVIGPLAWAGDTETPVPLWKAAEKKLVKVNAEATNAHSAARVTIESQTDDDLVIELNGSYLVPSGDDSQRLGIGVIDDRSELSRSTVRLGARKKTSVSVLTVCMDSGKRSPSNGAPYALAADAAPAHVASALAAWKADPAKYGQVRAQQAAWGRDDHDYERRAREREAEFERRQKEREEQPKARRPDSPPNPAPGPREDMGLPGGTVRVGIIDGEVFVLGATGTLSSARADGTFTELEIGVSDFVADGRSVHALFANRIARYDVFGSGRFVDELTVNRPGDLIWASAGGALVASDDGVFLVEREKETALGAAARALACDGGAVVVVPGKDSTEIARISCSNGVVTVASSSVAAVLSAAAPAGSSLYGITETGAVARIAFGLTTKVLEDVTELVPAMRSVVLRSGRDVCLVKGRDIQKLPRVSGQIVPDLRTGDLYAWKGDRLDRYDVDTGVWVRVVFKR